MNSNEPNYSHIASRVESLEGRFDANITKINSRLDQIVDLMTKVTQLQEREVKNADHIAELKVEIKDINTTIKDWNHRQHERMDKNLDDIKHCKGEVTSSIVNLDKYLSEKVGEVEKENRLLREEFQKWFNRGAGAWAFASILIIILQSMGAYIINGMLERDKLIEARIERNEERHQQDLKVIQDIIVKSNAKN